MLACMPMAGIRAREAALEAGSPMGRPSAIASGMAAAAATRKGNRRAVEHTLQDSVAAKTAQQAHAATASMHEGMGCLPVFLRVPMAVEYSEPWELALSREGRPSTEGRP